MFTKEEERDFLLNSIENTRKRIEEIRAAAERRVSWEEGHIRYLEQRIHDLRLEDGGTDGGTTGAV